MTSDSSTRQFLAAIQKGLERTGLPDPLRQLVLDAIPPNVSGVLLYGSWARGDQVEGSDVDIICLMGRPMRSLKSGDVSLSFYQENVLATGVGSLFGYHLARDGKIIWDPDGRLQRVLSRFETVDAPRLLFRCAELSVVLDVDRDSRLTYLSGLLREARYLLRSALYAEAILQGEPCFSVREIAARKGDPALSTLLASRHNAEPKLSDLEACIDRLKGVIPYMRVNLHGSLQALIVNEWNEYSDVVAMGLMALGSVGGHADDYAEVKTVLL